MATWGKYKLTDLPFLSTPIVKINSKDIRANGQIYYNDFAIEELELMENMIRSEHFPWIFLNTGGGALGNGKSAFMASIYWTLFEEDNNVLWASVRDVPKIRNLLAEIVESFVGRGKLQSIKDKLGTISTNSIKKALEKSPIEYGRGTIYSLNRLLTEDENNIIYNFSTIKRRNPTQNHAELFAALIQLSYCLGESRYTVFIDQFEEWVLAHNPPSLKRKMGNEINDLQRELFDYITFVVSTHPRVTNELISSVPEAETFTRVSSSSVDLPPMDEKDLLEMIGLYLKKFRGRFKVDNRFYPFTESFIKYAAQRTDLIPRDLIISMRLALVFGALNNHHQIDDGFIVKHHSKIFGGLENKYNDYSQKEWP